MTPYISSKIGEGLAHVIPSRQVFSPQGNSYKQHRIKFDNILHQNVLQKETATKYLGVKQLKWNKHVKNITASATSKLRLIKRNLKVN